MSSSRKVLKLADIAVVSHLREPRSTLLDCSRSFHRSSLPSNVPLLRPVGSQMGEVLPPRYAWERARLRLGRHSCGVRKQESRFLGLTRLGKQHLKKRL